MIRDSACERLLRAGTVFLFVFALAACESGPRTYVFVETLGRDTLAVEEFTRYADRIEGRHVYRQPTTQVATYTARLSPEGDISRLEVTWETPDANPDGPGRRHWIMTQENGVMTVERTGGQNPGTTEVEVGEAGVPTVRGVPMAYGILDQLVQEALARNASSMSLQVVRAGAPNAAANTLDLRSEDLAVVGFFGNPMHLMLDEEGHLMEVDGSRTTLKIHGLRVEGAEVDVDALAADFAARDARGEGLGVPSPRDEVQLSSAGADFEVVYSQPAKRGREIWGGLVPTGEVWRTGANSATVFSTNRDLLIGEAEVPAGAYSLWTVYDPAGTELILNSQTGQWGTAHDPEQDFVRIPLERDETDEPVERFTIDIEPTDRGGVLSLTWDRTRFTVPVRVR